MHYNPCTDKNHTWAWVISTERHGLGFPKFRIEATEEKGFTLPLKRITSQPIGWNSSPFPKEKLEALRSLVQEQLSEGHIEESTSPWNFPIFVTRKKSGKWRMLRDLRKIMKLFEPWIHYSLIYPPLS